MLGKIELSKIYIKICTLNLNEPLIGRDFVLYDFSKKDNIKTYQVLRYIGTGLTMGHRIFEVVGGAVDDKFNPLDERIKILDFYHNIDTQAIPVLSPILSIGVEGKKVIDSTKMCLLSPYYYPELVNPSNEHISGFGLEKEEAKSKTKTPVMLKIDVDVPILKRDYLLRGKDMSLVEGLIITNIGVTRIERLGMFVTKGMLVDNNIQECNLSEDEVLNLCLSYQNPTMCLAITESDGNVAYDYNVTADVKGISLMKSGILQV